tara:strand:+ start:327 stop:653 length:327 start_codon:yes stop_codon:yes gene_type:complete
LEKVSRSSSSSGCLEYVFEGSIIFNIMTIRKNKMSSKDLTNLERKVFCKMLQGWDNDQLADHLKEKRNNIKQIVHRIFKKFGVNSRPELLSIYISDAVIQTEERKLHG